MPTINEKALEVMLNEVAIGAGEIGGNNLGPHVLRYLNGIIDPPASWCQALVSWCFKEASRQLGIKMAFPYYLSARKAFDFFQKKGWIISDSNKPWPGDIMFLWRGEDIGNGLGHVGIVSGGYKNKNGKLIIQSCQGNRGDYPAKARIFEDPWGASVPQLLGYGRCPNA